MPNLTPEIESAVLPAVKAKVESVSSADNVFADDPSIDSKHDFIEKLVVQNVDGESETKYIKIDYLGWRDSLTDGCDDDPVVFLRYKIRLFHQWKPARSDNSTPAIDIKSLDLQIRNKFLETNRTLASGENLPLVTLADIILGVDELTGVYGYIRDLLLEVELSQ